MGALARNGLNISLPPGELLNKVTMTDRGEVQHVLVFQIFLHLMHCTIWYHLYYFKNVKDTHGGVLLLVRLQLYLK